MKRPKKFITPLEGRTVPKPGGGTLDPAGEVLTLVPYWSRRARDGDVTIAERPAREPAKKPPAKKPGSAD